MIIYPIGSVQHRLWHTTEPTVEMVQSSILTWSTYRHLTSVPNICISPQPMTRLAHMVCLWIFGKTQNTFLHAMVEIDCSTPHKTPPKMGENSVSQSGGPAYKHPHTLFSIEETQPLCVVVYIVQTILERSRFYLHAKLQVYEYSMPTLYFKNAPFVSSRRSSYSVWNCRL